jgi:hypothetical protein
MNARALIPEGVNSYSFVTLTRRMANLSEMVKPETGRGATNRRTCRTDRSSMRGRERKELPQNWETRPDSRRVRQGSPEINNRCESSGWESDGLVVATKRGNAR